jgi:hypothetical protein
MKINESVARGPEAAKDGSRHAPLPGQASEQQWIGRLEREISQEGYRGG